MLRALAMLMFLSAIVVAQPQPNPYQVIQASGSISTPRVTMRDSSIADILYILQNADSEQFAEHVVTSLTGQQLVTGPDTLHHTVGWSQQIGDVISRGNNGYLAVLYETSPYIDNYSSNRTTLVSGLNVMYGNTLVDSGGWRIHQTPPIDCRFVHSNSGFRIRERIGGGWLVGWTRNGCQAQYNFSEPLHINQVSQVSTDGAVGSRINLCRDPVVFLYGPTEGISVSTAQDSVVTLSLIEFGPQLVCANHLSHPNEYNQNQISSTPYFYDFRRDDSGRLLGITGYSHWYPDIPRQLVEIHLDGNISLLADVNILNIDAMAYIPNIGFAMVSVQDNSRIVLSRIENSGNEARPLSVFYESIPNRVISQIDVTMNSQGRIAVVWTERNNDAANVNEIMAGYVNWDTELSSPKPQPAPIPSSFSLSAYPNPFNSETKIKYSVAVAGESNLAVYNLNGQRVTVLYSGFQTAGSYSAVWSPAGGSGVYFVRLQNGDAVRTMKAVYLR